MSFPDDGGKEEKNGRNGWAGFCVLRWVGWALSEGFIPGLVAISSDGRLFRQIFAGYLCSRLEYLSLKSSVHQRLAIFHRVWPVSAFSEMAVYWNQIFKCKTLPFFFSLLIKALGFSPVDQHFKGV